MLQRVGHEQKKKKTINEKNTSIKNKPKDVEST